MMRLTAPHNQSGLATDHWPSPRRQRASLLRMDQGDEGTGPSCQHRLQDRRRGHVPLGLRLQRAAGGRHFARPYVAGAIEAFRPNRCVMESNCPNDGRSFGFVPLGKAMKRIVGGYSASEKDALFSGAAKVVYRMRLQKKPRVAAAAYAKHKVERVRLGMSLPMPSPMAAC